MTKVERGDAIDAGVLGRLGREVASAVRRRPANEERLAGVLRALAPVSPKLRAILLDASVALARRKSFDRPLFLAGVRAVAEGGEEGAAAVCELAITGEDPSGLAALSAAAFVQGRALGPLLSRSAASRHPQVAFAAELARVARGDSRGASGRAERAGLPYGSFRAGYARASASVTSSPSIVTCDVDWAGKPAAPAVTAVASAASAMAARSFSTTPRTRALPSMATWTRSVKPRPSSLRMADRRDWISRASPWSSSP